VAAVIDVGSHTVRLLIADLVEDTLVRRHYDHVVTHLGRGVAEHHALSAPSLCATLAVLESFAATIVDFGQRDIRVVGTEALRAAHNRQELITLFEKRTGLHLEVLDSQQEALYMAHGVLQALRPPPQRAVIFDIGGASTEFVCVERGQLRFQSSYRIGVVSLCDCDDPHQRMTQCADQLVNDLRGFGLWPAVKRDWVLVGTAGTVTTLAAAQMKMTDYCPERINNFHLEALKLDALSCRLAPLTSTERELLPGIEAGRGETIFAGVQFVRFLLELFKRDVMTVSDAGLLQGVFWCTWGQSTVLAAVD